MFMKFVLMHMGDVFSLLNAGIFNGDWDILESISINLHGTNTRCNFALHTDGDFVGPAVANNAYHRICRNWLGVFGLWFLQIHLLDYGRSIHGLSKAADGVWKHEASDTLSCDKALENGNDDWKGSLDKWCLLVAVCLSICLSKHHYSQECFHSPLQLSDICPSQPRNNLPRSAREMKHLFCGGSAVSGFLMIRRRLNTFYGYEELLHRIEWCHVSQWRLYLRFCLLGADCKRIFLIYIRTTRAEWDYLDPLKDVAHPNLLAVQHANKAGKVQCDH